jgi:glutaconate CoA-transferase subunit B
MADLFMLYLQGGLIDVALLGGAQIDRFGNLNTTVIGDYANPKIRLPGSGGACEIAINAKRILMIMRLSKRAFVEKLDFMTSGGHLAGPGQREALGMPGTGPDREMMLIELAPGETVESVQAEVGWPLRVAANVRTMTPPTQEELHIMRDQLDPDGLYR